MRQFSYITLIFCALLTIVCSSCNDIRPSYVPDNEEMASLLYDIHIMESIVKTRSIDKKTKASIYNQILQEHHLTPNDFDSCLAWFSNNKKEYKNVYNIVKLALEDEKNRILAGEYTSTVEDRNHRVHDFYSPFFRSKDSAIFYLPEIKLPPEFGRNEGGGYPYVERLGREPIIKDFRNQ